MMPARSLPSGVTTWIENPSGGRARGPAAMVRAWIEVLVRPRRFFETGVGPGDQAPGLTFAVAVAVAYAAGWMAVDPGTIPGIADSAALSGLVTLLVVGLLAAPAGLHLSAATAVIPLSLVVEDRAGVSETVQVLAYATAPMALAGAPIPALRVGCGCYGAALLVYGFRRIHATTWPRAGLAAVLPTLFAFGVGYRVIAAGRTLLAG